MVLRAFWDPLALLLGALGGLLGAILGLQIDPDGLLAEPSLPDQTDSKHFGSSHCLFFLSLLPFFSPLVVISYSKSFFILSWSRLGSILSSQDDLPNLQNLDLSSHVHRFFKNQGFRYEDGLESVLGPSWAPLRCSWRTFGKLKRFVSEDLFTTYF